MVDGALKDDASRLTQQIGHVPFKFPHSLRRRRGGHEFQHNSQQMIQTLLKRLLKLLLHDQQLLTRNGDQQNWRNH